jgi:SAM-dependent methyltransferase
MDARVKPAQDAEKKRSGTTGEHMTDPVHAQYEALPYPPRDPRDEVKRLVIGSPSHLAELNHFVFGGRLDFAKPFRALVAGGGTGDAAIMLAQQLADAGAALAEIVYVDWSEASRAVAEARAKARGLSNIRFVTGSLLELDTLAPAPFDYIDCCGVLHHLDSPAAGLSVLAGALAPAGGMGLMLYGALGRVGVYHVQALLATLAAPDDAPAARLAMARKLLAQLPATNWLKRNPFVSDHLVEGDAGLHDLLLHARDRAYEVGDVAAMVASAELRLVTFVPPARYEPASYLNDAAILKRIGGLPMIERAAFAERVAGNIKAHAFYVVRAGNAVQPPRPDDPNAIPVWFDADPEPLRKALKPGGVLNISAEGISLRFPLPRLATAIASAIDGKRNLRAISDAVAAKAGPLDWPAFIMQFAALYATLNGAGKLFLRLPA